ncbi:MAG TPA: NHL repeat-containing protein [Candidatus Binataceae bacterium]|nr:NHL repeat-containing protein [Candidatus Binataceae bacterium]
MIGGTVLGGLESVSGSLVTLYAAGNTGYGSAALTLGTGTSNAHGSFSIHYAKPAASRLLYLIATGGNTGLGANNAIKLMAVLGLSTALPPGSVVINELTTTAAVWPTVRFIDAASPQNVGTSSTNAKGLSNALAAVKNLVNVSNGQLSSFLPSAAQCAAATPPANCLTERKLDAVADILAACVQSAGPSKAFPGDCPTITSASPRCDQVLCYANATNTLAAAVNTALNPTVVNPVSHHSLPFNLVTTSSPFQPIPPSTPNDLTLGLNYVAAVTSFPRPNGIAIDAVGNAWVGEDNAVFELSPGGALLSPSTGYTGGGLGAANGVAIDAAANVWVANGTGGVTELNSSGTALSPPTGYANASTVACEGVAIDKSSNVWVTNNGSSTVAKLNSKGGFISPSGGFSGGGLNSPHEIAIDALSNVWVGNGPKHTTAGSVTKLNSAGSPLSPSTGYTGGGLSGTHGVAIDPSGHVWAANRSNSSVSELSSSGAPLSPASGFTGGGLNGPNEIETDSLGRVFAANQVVGSLTELSSAGAPLSPSGGFQGPGMTMGHRLAIDLSGNVWVTNDDVNHPAVIEFFGLAAPVKTPLNGPPKLP